MSNLNLQGKQTVELARGFHKSFLLEEISGLILCLFS
jgi:hypothetical protein